MSENHIPIAYIEYTKSHIKQGFEFWKVEKYYAYREGYGTYFTITSNLDIPHPILGNIVLNTRYTLALYTLLCYSDNLIPIMHFIG